MSILFNDANPDYLQWNTPPVTAAPFTMGGWMKTDDVTANQTLISIGATANGTNYWVLRFNTAGDRFQCILNDGAGAIGPQDTSQTYAADTWHFFCFVEAAANSHRLYTPGDVETIETTSRTPTVTTLRVGADATNGPFWPCSGDIFWPFVYNIALSRDNIRKLANRVHPYRVRRDALVAFPPLRGDAHHDNIRDLDVDTITGTPVESADPPGMDYLRPRHRRMLGSKVLR